jgi:hypothetical protein
MNKSVLVIALLAAVLTGCGASPEDEAHNAAQRVKMISPYKVTLVGPDGEALRTWVSPRRVELIHGVAAFQDILTGKYIHVSGTYVVEQL